MADLERLERAFRKAHEAGNTEDARTLAEAIRAERQRKAQSIDTSTTAGKLEKARLEGRDPTKMGGTREEQLDRMAAESPVGSFAANYLVGLPGVGSYIDEATGRASEALGGPSYENARDLTRAMERRNVGGAATRLAGTATGVAATLPMAIGAGRLAAPLMASSRAGRAVQAAGAGAFGGGLEGAIYGYGAGEGEGRKEEAVKQGTLGAGLGAGVGFLAPYAADLVETGARNIMNWRAGRRAAAEGMSPDATRVMADALQGDDLAEGVRNIRRAGDDAMVADVGPTAQRLLDTAVQRSGQGGRIAREAIEGRATGAQERVVEALNRRLGAPQGPRATARNISRTTQPARSNAYAAAYNAPIDYASEAGQRIEEVLSRVPQSTLRKAINEANEEMVSRGVRNQQILADIADDGTVTFREMPNVQQLDEIKQALERLAETDEFGRVTKQGLRPMRLAGELREAVGEAVPEYRAALSTGADKIAQDQGLRLGRNMLRSRVTREEIAESVEGASEAKLQAMRAGVRSYIDDTMSNVRRTITDPNIDAREAMQAVKELSSRANRQKLAMILPDDEAEALMRDIDRATQVLELRAATANNSATFARQAMERRVSDLTEGGPLATLQRGEPVGAAQRVTQALTGRTREAERAAQEGLYAEIARILTQPRGRSAVRAAEAIENVVRRQPVNAEIARALSRRAGVAAPALLHQAGMQHISR